MAAEGAASDSDDDGAVGKADDAQDFSDVELSEGDMVDDDDDEDDGVWHRVNTRRNMRAHVVASRLLFNIHSHHLCTALAQELEAAVQEQLEAEAQQRAARKARRRPPPPLCSSPSLAMQIPGPCCASPSCFRARPTRSTR